MAKLSLIKGRYDLCHFVFLEFFIIKTKTEHLDFDIASERQTVTVIVCLKNTDVERSMVKEKNLRVGKKAHSNQYGKLLLTTNGPISMSLYKNLSERIVFNFL